jgi:hypothetical protein
MNHLSSNVSALIQSRLDRSGPSTTVSKNASSRRRELHHAMRATAAGYLVLTALTACHNVNSTASLASQLRVRFAADQRVRAEMDSAAEALGDVDKIPDSTIAAWDTVDVRNTRWLKGILHDSGWPGYRLVGVEGSHQAWILLQHADKDIAFQQLGLTLMQRAVKIGDASAADMAYLVDRIRIKQGKAQLYGTQFLFRAGKREPFPIEDAEHVNDRRTAVGLPPLKGH